MIHLNYLGTSSVILRLTKVATILNPYYTFELINQQSKNTIIFTSTNLSPIPLIYDEFLWTSTTQSAGLTQGVLNVDKGVYTYNVYETQYEYNLNLGSASFLRSGELVVDGSNDFTYSTFTYSNNNVTPVFNINDYI
jgi:hypothetical protein